MQSQGIEDQQLMAQNPPQQMQGEILVTSSSDVSMAGGDPSSGQPEYFFWIPLVAKSK